MIAMDLSRQEAFNFNRKAMQPISFTEILDQAENTTVFFIIEEAIETILKFYTRNWESIVNSASFNLIKISNDSI